MRHTKIIATVGPASDSDAMLDALDRRRHRHLPPEFLARHARVAGGDVRARARGGRARRPRGRDSPGPRRPENPHRPPRRRQADRARRRRRAAHRHRRLRRRPGPRCPRRSTGWRAACGPAIGCCSPTASSSCASTRTDGTEIETTVVEGGEIGEHKGINAPGVPLPASAITPKDVDDLKFGLVARRGHGGAQLRADAPPICSRRAS